jgi:hypothetical protein
MSSTKCGGSIRRVSETKHTLHSLRFRRSPIPSVPERGLRQPRASPATERCHDCHTIVEAGGPRVDSRASLRGLSGRALIGDPAQSLLIRAAKQTGNLKMPQGGQLRPQEVQALLEWVKMGAPWLGSSGAEPATRRSTRAKSVPAAPRRTGARGQRTVLGQGDIDRLVLAKLEASQLKPRAAAARRTPIRRATLQLIGLPPTPEQKWWTGCWHRPIR